MCGRYVIDDEREIEEINRIIEEVNRKVNNPSAMKTGEIFPTNIAPVLELRDERPQLALMRWGFPKWDGKSVIINARSETAKEKPLFQKPLAEGRCVIPSTGFYEWQKKHRDMPKLKHLFKCPGSPMLYMAGICADFDGANGLQRCFVILTRGANEYMADIHDRMPVILYKNELKLWLSDDSFTGYAFDRAGISLERYAVSQTITSLNIERNIK